jgi:outer membrane protein assembly factor BamB
MIEETRYRPPSCAGCLLPLLTLLVGVGLGVFGTITLLGIGWQDLLARGQVVLSGGPLPTAAPLPPVQAGPQAISGGTASGQRLVWHSPIALDSDSNEPDMLVISRNYAHNSDTLAYYSPDKQSFRWESAPLGEQGNGWLVVTNGTTIFVADTARLFAINRSDGKTLWEITMSDEISYSICSDCLQAFPDTVVALPSDGVLQAFDAATGQLRWNVRLREATRQLVQIDGLVGAIDSRAEDTSEAALFLYNPQSGDLVRSIEPVCQQSADSYEDRPHFYDPFISDGRGGLYWLMDSASCLQRIDAANGNVSWQALVEDFNGGLTAKNTLFSDDNSLYVSDGEELTLISAQGESRRLLVDEDYNLYPLAARSGTLLAFAERTRGSRRYEIWAINSSDGARRWAYVLQGDDPLEELFDTGDFAANIVGESVVLVEQKEEPETIEYVRLNLADGSEQARTALTVEDAGDYMRGALWGRGTLWLAIDELYAVDLASGATTYRWP